MRRLVLPLCLLGAAAGGLHAANASITVSVTVTVAAIDIQWADIHADDRLPGDSATVLLWALGNKQFGATVNGESTTYPRRCTVENLGADVQLVLTLSNAVGAGVAWTPGAASGNNVYTMAAKLLAAPATGTSEFNETTYTVINGATDQLRSLLLNTATVTFYPQIVLPSAGEAEAKTITITTTASTPP